MKVSNRVKRNLFFAVIIIGILNCIAIIIDMIMAESSLNNWMQLSATLGLTLFAFAYFIVYRKRVKKGIRFGNSNYNYN